MNKITYRELNRKEETRKREGKRLGLRAESSRGDKYNVSENQRKRVLQKMSKINCIKGNHDEGKERRFNCCIY